MDLAVGSNFTLPLFIFDETLQTRDPEQPDLTIDITLDKDLLDHICQNPEADSSICVYINQYKLNDITTPYADISSEHTAQLQITQGPSIAAMLNLSDDRTFVSPQMDFLPTFDLDIEEDQQQSE